MLATTSDVFAILSDPAFNVRLDNIYSYFKHVSEVNYSFLNVIIGGGPYSFLDYSVQFGKPGHFDNLYFRALSEYGVLSIFVILILLISSLLKNRKLFVPLTALAIGALVSEALLTLKVAHLFFLVILMIKSSNDRNL